MTLTTSVILLIVSGVAEIVGRRSYAVALLWLIPAVLAVGIYTACRSE